MSRNLLKTSENPNFCMAGLPEFRFFVPILGMANAYLKNISYLFQRFFEK
jgi:hypothetical protein